MSDQRGQAEPDFTDFYGDQPTLPVMRSREDMPDPDPSGWLDTVTASFRAGRRDIGGYNIEHDTHEYQPVVDAVTAANGKPWTLYVNPQTGQTDREGVWQEIARIRAAEPGAFKDLPATRAEFDKQAAATTKAQVERDKTTIERGAGSAWLIGGIGAGFTDPLNLGTMFIGGPGKTIGQRIISESILNMGIEAIEQPLVAKERAERGEKLTIGEASANIGVAGVAGGAFQGLIAEPIGALVKRFRATVPLDQMTDAERAAVDMLQREVDVAETSPFAPGLGTEVHAQRLNQSMEAIANGLPGAAPTPRTSRAALNSGTSLGSGVVGMPTDVSGSTARSALKQRIARAENATGNPNARPIDPASGKPLSSALGKYQFTEGTWKQYYTRRYGRGGLTDAQIAAKRTDGALQDQLVDDLISDNARALSRIGAKESAGNLYLMHFAGEGGGSAILRAAPDTPIERVLKPEAIAANKFLRGKTAGEVVEWAHRKMGERVDESPTLRRDVFPEGDDGNAAWREAQRASDDAELQLQRAQADEDRMRMAYLGDGAERQAARTEAADRPAAPDEPAVPFARDDFATAYGEAGERQAARSEDEGRIDPEIEPVHGDWADAEQPTTDAEPATGFTTEKGSTYAIETDRATRRNQAAEPARTVYLSGRGAEQLEAARARGATIEADDVNGAILAQSDRGVESIPFTAEPGYGMRPLQLAAGKRPLLGTKIVSIARPTARKIADGWDMALKEGAAVARPASRDITGASGTDGLKKTIGAEFGDPTGPAAKAMADGITHDISQALDTGELGNISFAADGVEGGLGEVAPRYRNAREVLAELDADDAAISAIEACL